MKIGLIGLGAWSQKLIKCLPNPEHLFCVLSNRVDAKDVLPHGTLILRTFDEFIETGLDRIIIANQASKHQFALKKIRHALPTIPILIEKPFATTHEEICEYINQFGLDENILVNHTLLFNKSIEDIKKKYQKSKPLKINCADCNLGPFRMDCSSLWDYGPHPISIALYLTTIDESMLDVEVIDAKQVNTSFGSITNFRLILNNETEMICSIGNGFPLKVRKYLFAYNENDNVEFDGIEKVDPEPLNKILMDFCELKKQNRLIADGRWGLKIPINVVKIIDEIEKKLVSS